MFSLRAAGVNLLAIDRGSRLATETETIRLPARTELRADDILLVDVVATVAEKLTLMDRYKVDVLPLGDDPGYLTDAHDGVGMAEAMLSPESSLIGHTVLQARIRSEQGLTVIGLRRGGEPDPDRWYDPVLVALQRTGSVQLAADAMVALLGGAAHSYGDMILDHHASRIVHFQHGDRGADGTGRSGVGLRPRGIAIPICHDRSVGFINGFHDADLFAGEHACCRIGKLRLLGLCAYRHAFRADRIHPQCAADATAIAARLTDRGTGA